MPLARDTIIEHVATRLAAPTDRVHPLDEGELPGWRVGSDIPESITPAFIDGSVNEHRLPIVAEGFVRAVDDSDAAAHALASAALAAIFAAPVPYGLQHEGTEVDFEEARAPTPGRQQAGESAVVAIRLRLSAHYFVAPSAPDSILSN
jgi:hypothetical protein